MRSEILTTIKYSNEPIEADFAVFATESFILQVVPPKLTACRDSDMNQDQPRATATSSRPFRHAGSAIAANQRRRRRRRRKWPKHDIVQVT